MAPDLIVLPSPDAVAQVIADQTAEVLLEALDDHARTSLCLTHGPLFESAYRLLATHRALEWDRVHLFWTDERMVPTDHESSAFGMAQRALIEPAGIPADNLHPIEWNHDADVAARLYEADLEVFFGADGARFDMLHLGVGPDGSTASLFPGSDALAERSRRAIATNHPPSGAKHDRVTLSLTVLSRAQHCVIAAIGSDVSQAVATALTSVVSESAPLPIALVTPARAPVWIVDAAAGQDVPVRSEA